MKKSLVIIFFVLVIIGCLLYAGYDYATDYVVKKTLLIVAEDKELQAQIEAALEQVPLSPSENTEETTGEDKTEAPPLAESPSGAEVQPSNVPTSVQTDDGKLSIDDLQPSDKNYVMSIYKRFTASEVNQVTAMLTDGITPEEKQIIKSIVYAKVSQEEVNKLYTIAKKYQ